LRQKSRGLLDSLVPPTRDFGYAGKPQSIRADRVMRAKPEFAAAESMLEQNLP